MAGVQQQVDIAEAFDAPNLATADSVETGCTINGIFLVIEILATTAGALSNCYLAIWKDQGSNLTIPLANAIGTSDSKRFSIHQEMVMVEKQVNGNPRTLFKGVIAIPKGYRRFGPKDRLVATIFPPGVNIDVCFQCHYKEFR